MICSFQLMITQLSLPLAFALFTYTTSQILCHSHQFADAVLISPSHQSLHQFCSHHCCLLQTSLQFPRHAYRARLCSTSLWPFCMQGQTFEVKGWCRLRHLWFSSYTFLIHSFINPSFRCFISASVFSLCFIFWSGYTTPWSVLLLLVSSLFADRTPTLGISSLHLHVYSSDQLSYIFLVSPHSGRKTYL